MSDSWYFARDNNRFGPYSMAQMQEMAASGRLAPQDMVLREGSQKWVSAGSVPDFFPPAHMAIPVAIPVPPQAVPAGAPPAVGVPSPPPSMSDSGDAPRPSERGPVRWEGRSTQLVVAGVVNVLVGLLGVALGVLGLQTFLSLLEQSQFSRPVAYFIESLDKAIPGWIYLEIGKAALVLVLGLGLVIAAIGLLLRQRWARWYSIAYGLAAILLHTGYLAFQFGWVMPETSNYLARQRQQSDDMAALVGMVGVAGLFIIHGLALVVILLSHGVARSFARRR